MKTTVKRLEKEEVGTRNFIENLLKLIWLPGHDCGFSPLGGRNLAWSCGEPVDPECHEQRRSNGTHWMRKEFCNTGTVPFVGVGFSVNLLVLAKKCHVSSCDWLYPFQNWQGIIGGPFLEPECLFSIRHVMAEPLGRT